MSCDYWQMAKENSHESVKSSKRGNYIAAIRVLFSVIWLLG